MAFQTGTQINPALGAVNYTPYMQGALMGAQAIGQGLASLGQAAGQAVQQYYEKKENKELFDSTVASVSNFLRENPDAAATIGVRDPSDAKAIGVAIKAMGGNDVKRGVSITQGLISQYAMQQQQAQAAAAAEQAKQRREGLIASYAADAARSGQPVPMVVPNELRGPAELKAIELGLKNKPKDPDMFTVAYGAFNQANPNATPEQVLKFVEDQRKNSAQTTNIDIAGNAFDKEAAKYGAERMGKVYELANNLPQQFAKLQEAQSVVDTEDINTGILADFRQQFDRLKGTTLGDRIANNRASKTEYLEALLGSDVFSQIQALGIGARGLDTVAERQFIQKSITGDKTMTKDTIKQMIDLRQKVLKNVMEDYNKGVERGDYDRFFEKSGLPKRKIEIPAQAPAATTDVSKMSDDALRARLEALRSSK